MEKYQERVLEEKLKLDEKIVSLFDFLYSTSSSVVSSYERKLLAEQLNAMMAYSGLLHERIDLF